MTSAQQNSPPSTDACIEAAEQARPGLGALRWAGLPPGFDQGAENTHSWKVMKAGARITPAIRPGIDVQVSSPLGLGTCLASLTRIQAPGTRGALRRGLRASQKPRDRRSYPSQEGSCIHIKRINVNVPFVVLALAVRALCRRGVLVLTLWPGDTRVDLMDETWILMLGLHQILRLPCKVVLPWTPWPR